MPANHAGTVGQLSWALFEWARNPYYILIVIYIFGPYFSNEVIGDPVRGQEIWGYINGVAGAATACLAPFLGAIADKVGRRKPWIGAFMVMMIPAILLLWLAVPGEEGLGIITVAVALTVAGTGFAFTEVFHNAMLPSIVPYRRLGTVSGWGLALGNGGAVIILVAMLYAFALPASGLLDWAWLPEEVLFGLDTSTFEQDRIAAPISAVWLVAFSLPLFLFTPDRNVTGASARAAVRQGLADVRRTILRVRSYRNVALYLLARMLFNDGKVAIRGDDQVLRPLRPVRSGDGVRCAHSGGLLHRLLRQPAGRLRLDPAAARRGIGLDGLREGGARQASRELVTVVVRRGNGSGGMLPGVKTSRMATMDCQSGRHSDDSVDGGSRIRSG